MQKTNRFICDQGEFRHEIMRSTILILILLFSLLLVPTVFAEDPLEWYTYGQNALTAGDYPTAVTSYNNALEIDRNYAPAYAGRAAALNMLGKYTEAIASADSCLALKSMDPVALNARALGLFKLGRYEEATSAYDKLFLVDLTSKEAYCNQAYAYMKINKTDTAITVYDRCTTLDPVNFENWNNLGLALMQVKKYDEALSAFGSATELTIKNATIWNNKGVALMALGKPTDALQCFNKALGIDPDYTEAQKNKKDAMGKQQSFNISGTIKPTVTISRIGTFFTIVTTTSQPTEIVTQAPDIGGKMTGATTTQVPKKTTYAPVSPLTVLIALAVVAGIVAVMRKERI
jgi:tetratricopeptide (TPR) repeat protein